MKLFNLLIILVLLLAITGCSGSAGRQPLAMKDFRVGDRGLTLSFVPDDRPIEVLENDTFNLDFDIKNEGAYDVTDLYVAFGYETDYLNLKERKFESLPVTSNTLTAALPEGKLQGRSPRLTLGGNAFYESILQAKYITLSKFQITTVNAIACYNYATIAETSVCIQPKNTMLGLQDVCEAKDQVLTPQGSPLAVTGVKVLNNVMIGETGANMIRSQFKIQIDHVGTGNVIKSQTAAKVCSSGALRDEKVWNYFHAKVFLGEKELKCRYLTYGNGYLARLRDGGVEIICEDANPIASGGYTRPLRVELAYDYTQSISRQISIERYS